MSKMPKLIYKEHSTRDKPIRICSFRVEAENNIFYMKAVLA